ncbi:prepilin peptidase [Hydrogenophaga pseudoflava]|uniref:prepilin peptidase n=1 Tax=Hydrogenophaga pseudoflava TaxID=47421 RepID=UPI000824A406|nr:prepilin peptidase [Hydrogenophaga pseudoflava]
MNFDTAAGQWQAAALGLLGLCLALAALSDARQRRIPNALVLMTLTAGLLLNAFGPQPFLRNPGLFSPYPGALGIGASLLGALVALLLFLPFYALRVLGAGDVKLLAAVGAFAGPAESLNLALCVLLAGGVLALGRMAAARNARLVMQNTLASLGQMLPGSAGSFDASTQTAWRMPYAVAIAAGVAGYAAWTLSGRAPFIAFG